MEEETSGDEHALLVTMRALARRGAGLRKAADGAAIIEQADQRPARQISPAEFLRLLDAGWIRSTGMDHFVISKRGATEIRAKLSRPLPGNAKLNGKLVPNTLEKDRIRSERSRAAAPGFNGKESPLAWLAQRQGADGKPMLTPAQVEAGERLRVDFELGNMGPRVTASWNPAASPSGQSRSAPGMGVDVADGVIDARRRVEMALKAIGPELSGVLLDVCCFLKGLEQVESEHNWPRRSGKIYLKLALSHLARHYGIPDHNPQAPRQVRIWHDDGWSPTRGGLNESDQRKP